MKYTLEVIGFNIENCRMAQSAGANRIELCDNPGEGGTTPSYGFIKAARALLHIELYPIIRPRGGDFLYSDAEFEIMKSDIRLCKELGCDGIVTGILNADGTVDSERCSRLADLAYPMGLTFHRAFDRTADAITSMETIINCGFERILTSGQQPNAMDGAGLIAELVKQAGDRISIMPGSGVSSANIVALAGITAAREFHTSARTMVPGKMAFNQPSMKEEMLTVSINEEEIRKIISLLSTC